MPLLPRALLQTSVATGSAVTAGAGSVWSPSFLDAAAPVACFLGVADAAVSSPSAFRFAGLGLKNDAIDAMVNTGEGE